MEDVDDYKGFFLSILSGYYPCRLYPVTKTWTVLHIGLNIDGVTKYQSLRCPMHVQG